VIFASEASGKETIPGDILQRLLPSELPEEEKNYRLFHPLLVGDAAQLQRELEGFRSEKRKARQLVAVYPFWDKVELVQMEALLNKAREFCANNKQKNVWLRVIFIVSPPAAAAWVRLPQEKREAILRQAEIVRVAPWSLDGLKQRLEREEFYDTADREFTSRLLELTGGWHILLERVFERYYEQHTSTDVKSLEALVHHAESIVQQLTGDELNRLFGFDKLPESVSVVMRFIAAYQGESGALERELVNPKDIHHDAVRDEDTCQRALMLLEYLHYIEAQGNNVAVNNPLLLRCLVEKRF
jgi:hypothetical protein